jgi:type II secretory pathway pseudopilin PulG
MTLAQRPIGDERGFVVSDLLIVVIVIGVLIAATVVSYLFVRDTAEEAAASVNVRTAVPAVESWRTDNRGTPGDIDGDASTAGYEGLTTIVLRDYYRVPGIAVPVAAPAEYCIASTVGRQTFFKYGPDGPITEVTFATPLCT